MPDNNLKKIDSMFFMPYGIKNKHFERGLENLQRQIDKGEKVGVIVCNKSLLSCFRNLENSYIKCLACVSRRKNGLSLINGDFNTFNFSELSYEESKKIKKTSTYEFQSIKELKKLYIDSFDIGYAISSTLITHTKNPNPNLYDYKDIVNDLIWSAGKVYFSVKRILEEQSPNKVFFHNGRHALGRAVLRACDSLKINYISYESGFRRDEFMLYENGMPQNPELREKQIRKHWEKNKNLKEKRAVAKSYYIDQRNGRNAPTEKFNFVKGQKETSFPENWSSKKKNIVIYNSTENEFAAIDDSWNLPFYKNQNDAIIQIINSLENIDKEIQIYLRIHPNYSLSNDPSIQEIYKIKSKIFKIIDSNSDVSSYSLIEEADVVLTFVSTVGVESVFWGTPTILLGNAFYKNLGGFYIPRTHDECIELLLKDLKPMAKTGPLMWGYYNARYGIKYKYYKPINHDIGYFKNKLILPSSILIIFNKSRWRKRLRFFDLFARYFRKKLIV